MRAARVTVVVPCVGVCVCVFVVFCHNAHLGYVHVHRDTVKKTCGRVHAQAYNYYAWAECAWVAK